MKNLKRYPHFTLFISILLTLLSTNWLTVRALPPRPTPAPAEATPPRGAEIELHVEGIIEGIWTIVQWEDAMGNWHDVGGWQGTLDEGNIKTWWVGETDLGTGPFRWLVTQEGNVLGISDAFYLPAFTGKKMSVLVLTD